MVDPEDKARLEIDAQLEAAGWVVCDTGAHDISKRCAIREFPLKACHGHAGYLLHLRGITVRVVEDREVSQTRKGVEVQSEKFTKGLTGESPRKGTSFIHRRGVHRHNCQRASHALIGLPFTNRWQVLQ